MLIILIISVFSYLLCKKYSQKLYEETEYDSLNGANKLLMILIWAIQFGFYFIYKYWGFYNYVITLNLMRVIVCCVWAAIIYRNRKLKNPTNIIIISLLQLFAGIGCVVVAIWSFCEKTSGPRNSGASTSFYEENPEEYTQYQTGYNKGLDEFRDPMERNMSPAEYEGYKAGCNQRDFYKL